MIAKVVVDISTSDVDKIFEYNIPAKLSIHAGDRVGVPFGSKVIEGYCIEVADKAETTKTLKDISSKLDNYTAISEEMLKLCDMMREKYNLRYADVLRLFVPSMLRGNKIKEKVKTIVSLPKDANPEELKALISNRAKSQKGIIDELKNKEMDKVTLNSLYSPLAVKSLIDRGFIIQRELEVYRIPFKGILGNNKEVSLTKEQIKALEIISESDKPVLLHGVTGSGKTEVYMRCIEDVLSQGKTAIMLVPEISLTPQTLKTFRARFGNIVAMIHSGLSDGERFDEWRRLLLGDAKIVVGARSAVFSPLQNLGIIIIDEEHDGSYSSDSNPRYKTIDVAKFRSIYNNATLLLGSATPSIETYYLTTIGKYNIAKMTTRIGAFGMPKIDIVNMSRERIEGNNKFFSKALIDAMRQSLDRGEQVMLFLNRRGYQSFMMCKNCGYVVKCPHCDVSLTYHRHDNRLKCHFCGKQYMPVDICPECGSELFRFGKIGTEKVVEELKSMFEGVKILRLDNDTVGKKSDYMKILTAFANKEASILVGTQMIAKGHDFSNVTLVGIIDADIGLYTEDYRASERTFQLITQVSGRAGRAEKGGRVILQTYSPNHYVFGLVKNNDYLSFFEKESNTRMVTKYPPFSTIVKLMFSSQNEEKAIQVTKQVLEKLKILKEEYKNDFIFLQRSKEVIYKAEDKYRLRVIMKLECEKAEEIIQKIYKIVNESRLKDVISFTDVNPSVV